MTLEGAVDAAWMGYVYQQRLANIIERSVEKTVTPNRCNLVRSMDLQGIDPFRLAVPV